MPELLQWGIISTGHIAHEFADGVKFSSTGQLVAVGSRSQESAERFGDEFGIPRRYGSYDDLLADDNVEAVYVATPHPFHAEWAIKAAEAGKHVLVEKPIGMNYAEAMAMIDAAMQNDVFLMEAFMYRCHPQTARLAELIGEGVIGEVVFIQSAFSYNSNAGPENRAFAQELGGGGILDVGCYPASAARLVAGAAAGKPFEEPLELRATGHIGPTGVDYWATASVKFPGGIGAQLTTGVALDMRQDNVIRVFGSEGKILVPDPWTPSRWNRDDTKIIVTRYDDPQPRTVIVPAPNDLYTYEADTVAAHIADRQAPQMSWDDTLGNMRLLDAWRKELGLVYDLEKPANVVRTVTGRPLTTRTDTNMQYGRVAGLDKDISRLIMGADSNNTMPDTAIMFDDYFQRGGRAFDTSHQYGNPLGACETNLGWWIRNRGIRDEVVVIAKGANAPHDNPDGLTKELIESLENMGLDCVDIYMIHRDNPDVPVGEWVDVLNENLRAGRMTTFGLSNFTVPRLIAFQEYAHKHGLQSFCAVSNQFSLAQLLAPIWDCYLVSSSDAESRRWFEETQTPLFSWSSQARGFFTERAGRRKKDDPELVRCWYSDENFRRRDRAVRLAEELNVEPINIALAYVLCQPFPTFTMIGPKRPWETRSCLRALDIKLTPDQLRWLNLEE